MRPTRLEIKNFMSHESTVVPLNDITIGVITGPNGAGKSSILQAITYALWGKTKARSDDDLVKRGTSGCAVSLDFDIAGHSFNVIRRRRLAGRGETDLEFTDITLEDFPRPLTKGTIRDTQEAINATIGMSYDVFTNSVLLQQGEGDKFSAARPGERKQLLAEMLEMQDLQYLEGVARAYSTGVNGNLEGLRQQLAMVLDEIEDLDRGENNTQKITSDIYLAESSAKEAKTRLELLREERSELSRLLQFMDTTKLNISAASARLDTTRASIATSQRELEHLNTLMEHSDRVVNEYAELEAVEDALAKILASDGPFSSWTEMKRIDSIIKAREDALHTEAKEVVGLVREYQQKQKAISALKSEWESAAEHRNKMGDKADDLEVEIVDAEALVKECIRDATERYSLLTETRKRLGELRDQSICPTCRQEIEDPTTLIATIEEEIATLEDAYDNAEGTGDTHKEYARRLKEKLSATQALFSEARESTHKINTRLEVARSELDAIQVRLDAATACQEKLATGNFALELREQRAKLVDSANQYNPAEHAELQQRKKGLGGARDRYLTLQKADAAKTGVENKIDLLLDAESDLMDEIRKAREVIAQYEAEANELSFPDFGAYDAQIRIIERGLAALNENLDAHKRRLAEAEIALERLANLKKKSMDIEDAIEETEVEAETVAILVKATSKTGAQALVIESALPIIEEGANKYLAEMSPGMSLALETQRETKTRSSTVETLDIMIYSDGRVTPVEMLSGGERFRADLALRLAIGSMLTKTSYGVETLCIDEGFGSQDIDGQESIMEVIGSLANMFSLILVITHVSTVASTVGVDGSIVQVTKSGGKSSVEISD